MSARYSRQIYRTVAIVAALTFVYASVLTKLGRDWWGDENYSHGLLIPFVIGYILWEERKRIGELAGKDACAPRFAVVWGAFGVALSLLMLWAGTAGTELFVQRISLVLMVASVAIYFAGFRFLRLLAAPLLLLLLSIPIPQILFNRIAFPLQIFASRCAVAAMALFEIPVLRQGNIIELMPRGAKETKKLAVVEACSGIRSLMTLVALAVVYAYFTKPKSREESPDQDGAPRWAQRLRRRREALAFLKGFSFWRAVLLIGAAVPIAILTNALRVSGTGVLAHYYGTRVADGFFHSFSGWVIYVAAAMLLLATGWALDRLARLRTKGQRNLRALRVSVVESNPAK